MCHDLDNPGPSTEGWLVMIVSLPLESKITELCLVLPPGALYRTAMGCVLLR